MTIAYVYKWTHLPTLMWYVGSRTSKYKCIDDDNYICSSKYVRPLIENKRTEWVREIIDTGTTSEMLQLEEEILILFDAKNDPRSFNRNNQVMRKDGSSIKGKKRIYLGNVQLLVTPIELPLFLKQGWKMGWSKTTIEKFRIGAPDYSGSKNPMFGKKRNAPNKGVAMSEEQKQNLRVPKNKKVRDCCGIMCSDSNYARWHGKNCKANKLGASELNEQTFKGEI